MQKTRTGMLRSLLHDIVSSCRSLIPVIFPDIWAHFCKMQNLMPDKINIEDGLTLSELSKAFLLLVQQKKIPVSICCFIDGLDEHEGSDREILDILMELCRSSKPNSKSTSAFKMCVSARPHNAFEATYERCLGIRIHQHTEEDIALYTLGRLQAATQTTFPRTQEESQELWKIADKIVRESSGIFLWVRLAVESLLDGLDNQDFARQLWERVRLLPKDLEEFYAQMIRRIPDLYRQEAFRIFKIILDSPQHFKQIRMLCYTTVEIDVIERESDKYLGDTWEQAARQMRTRLKSICGGLLEVLEDNEEFSLVQFIHQSAKDYLRDPSFRWDLLVGTNNMGFNVDLFILDFQLCLHQREVYCIENPDEEVDCLSLYIARAEKTTGVDQISATKRWQQKFNKDIECMNGHCDCKLALLDDFTALAVNQGILSWLRYQVERAGLDVNCPTKLGLPLFYYAIEENIPPEYEYFEEYNGWAWNEPRLGSPNAEMVHLLLRYQKMRGDGGVNDVPNSAGEFCDELELHLSPTESRWMTCSPWKAFLGTLADPDWVDFFSASYMSLEDLADEYLKILELFLQYGADHSELGENCGPNYMRTLDVVFMRFKKVGRNKLKGFKSVLEAYGIDVCTGEKNNAVFDCKIRSMLLI